MTKQLALILKATLSAQLVVSSVWAESLTLEQFKSQVQQQNPGWKAAESDLRGSGLLEKEAEAMTSIQLTSQISFLDDQRPTNNPNFMGTKTEYSSFLLGFKQQTELGIQWALTQNFTHTHIYDASVLPVPNFYDAYPKLELNIPLWRNFLGAETSSQKDQLNQQAISRKKQAELATLQKSIEIETAFFAVLAQQQILETQRDSIARAERILQWTKNRIFKNLADGSDIYQSQAAVSARKMELATTQKNLSDAIYKFNSLRGKNTTELKETLMAGEILSKDFQLTATPTKVRKDLLLKQLQTTSAIATQQAQREKYKPQLDLSLQASRHGRDLTLAEAQSNITKDTKDYFLVAVNFNMPLNQFQMSDFRQGYADLAKSQRYSAEDRILEQSVVWNNTVEQSHQLEQQWVLARDLETLQKNKADAERDKFNRGRSTLFQVLMYEQDYFSARTQRINLELMIRQFVSQLALFE